MKKIIIYLLIAASQNCLSEELTIIEKLAYNGTIANQEIFMSLTTRDNIIFGDYFYEKYKTPIHLQGKIENSEFSLREKTASSYAHINAKEINGKLTGTWTNGKNTHKLYATPQSRPYKSLIKEVILLNSGESEKTIRIHFNDKKNQEIMATTLTQQTLLIFEDFTFDGHPDMRILELEAGGNSSFIFFDYNPIQRKFTLSPPEIQKISSPKVQHYRKSILSLSKDGCCRYYASKLTPDEVRTAQYDYTTGSGSEKATNKTTKKSTEIKISKDYFEKNYINTEDF